MTRSHPEPGFSLLEIVISISIFATIILVAFQIFPPAAEHDAKSREYVKIKLALQEQKEVIKSLGFWVWDGDTAVTNNAQSQAEKWKTRLTAAGLSNRGTFDTTFLKDVSGNLVPFSGAEFDGNLPRNKVLVTLTLYTQANAPVTEGVHVHSVPTIKGLWAQYYIIKTALDEYYVANGNSYPPTQNLGLLVSTYLAEIPNDPYTSVRPKITHLEELPDWYYSYNGTTVNLAANSHRETVSGNFSAP